MLDSDGNLNRISSNEHSISSGGHHQRKEFHYAREMGINLSSWDEQSSRMRNAAAHTHTERDREWNANKIPI